MPNIQTLLDTDISWIVQELRELPKQSATFADVPDDVNYVAGYLTVMYHSGLLGGVVNRDYKSFLLWTRFRPWYADRLEVHEIILWVPEIHRGSRIAPYLIRSFVEAAKAENPHSIHAGASLDITAAERTLKLYEQCGFTIDRNGATMRIQHV